MNARTLRSSMVWAFTLLLVVVAVAGCHKNPPMKSVTESAPRSQPSAGPAPTLTLSVSPGTIEKGQAATLTWNASNAQTVTIEPLGTVPTSGSRTVTPETSTTYAGKAVSGSQTAEATARLTVTTAAADANADRSGNLNERTIGWADVRDIHFDFDRYDIRLEDRTVLNQDAEVFKKEPNATIVVQGHCDERGTEEYNQALGDRRATATKEALVRMGVPAGRITTVSFGESKPIDPGHTEEAWAKNRRAHFEKQQ